MMYLGKDAVGLATSIPVFGNKIDIEYGEYTPDNDILSTDMEIDNKLGVMPDFLIYHAENFILNTYNTPYTLEGSYSPLLLNAGEPRFGLFIIYLPNNSTTIKTSGGPVTISNLNAIGITNNKIKFFSNSSAKLKGGITYKYIIGKYKEVTSNANE